MTLCQSKTVIEELVHHFLLFVNVEQRSSQINTFFCDVKIILQYEVNCLIITLKTGRKVYFWSNGMFSSLTISGTEHYKVRHCFYQGGTVWIYFQEFLQWCYFRSLTTGFHRVLQCDYQGRRFVLNIGGTTSVGACAPAHGRRPCWGWVREGFVPSRNEGQGVLSPEKFEKYKLKIVHFRAK